MSPSWFRTLLTSFPVVLCLMPSFSAQQSSQQDRTRTPAKVWTNDNIPHAQSGASVNGSPNASSRSTAAFKTYSDGATFINPKPGQLVRPGEVLHIDIALDHGVTLSRGAAIMSPIGFSSEIRTAPPYSFTFDVPNKDVSGNGGPLIGLHPLDAIGDSPGRSSSPGSPLAQTTIDVEEPDLPVALFAAGGMMSNRSSSVNFYGLGDEQSISIYAKFSNGDELDVTNSGYLQLASDNAAVVRVVEGGWIMSVGAGQANLTATYSLDGQQKELRMPVSVKSTSRLVTVSPAVVDFGDIPVGTKSSSQQVTVTNNSSYAVKIYDIKNNGSDNCSNRTLVPGDSCTITVSLTLSAPGPGFSKLWIPNSAGSLGVSLIWRGI